MIDLILNLANVFVLIGTLFNVKDVLKNKNILKGYSIFGSFFTFISLVMFGIVFYFMNIWTWMIEVFTCIYWLLAFIYSLKNWLNENNK